MTGWVAFPNNGFFCAYADILLSQKNGGVDINHKIPVVNIKDSYGNLIDKNTSGWTTVGLCQKIVLIDDRLAFLWSGRFDKARDLEEELRRLDTNNIEKCQYIINDIANRYIEMSRFSAIILLRIDTLRFAMVPINVDRQCHSTLGEMLFGGWGGEDFHEVAAELANNLPAQVALEEYEKGLISKQESDAYTRSRLIDDLLEARIAFDDFRSVATGGCVETIKLIEGKWTKGGNKIFAIFNEDDYKEIGFCPRFVVKRAYHENMLAVSIQDYLTGGRIEAPVATPMTRWGGHTLDSSIYDPWTGSLNDVGLIILRKDGVTRSYLNENPLYFRDNVRYDRDLRRPVLSEHYIEDLGLK